MSQKSVNRAAGHGAICKTKAPAKKPTIRTTHAKTAGKDGTNGRKIGKRKAARSEAIRSKTARPKKAKPRINWTAVGADWRAGIAVREIAQRHAISPSAIYRRARKHRWRRAAIAGAPGTAPLGATADAVIPTSAAKAAVPGTAGRGAVAARSPAPDDLARLRSLATKLRERLERVIDGEPAADAVLGARESPAALLLKLCQITEKIIAIERRVAGADAPTRAELNEQDRDILKRFKHRYGVG